MHGFACENFAIVINNCLDLADSSLFQDTDKHL